MKIKPLDRTGNLKPHISINIVADAIDLNHVYVYCPICKKTRYSCKPVLHIHGSGANLNNRLETRSGHCYEHNTTFNIAITDETKRL